MLMSFININLTINQQKTPLNQLVIYVFVFIKKNMFII